MNPLISIIVPIYNSKKTLCRCVDSILNQTFTDWELLLIDDGSKDKSGEICDEYTANDFRIKTFHKVNGGVSSARNIGLDNASGKWVTFVDSDDWVYPDYLNNYVRCLDDNIDLVVQGFNSDKPLFSDENLSENKYFSNFDGSIFDGIPILLKNDILGFLWIKLFNNTIIKKYKLRFNEKLNLSEDEEFILRYLVYCKKIIAIDEIGYFYNVPNWQRKYQIKRNSFELYKSMYESVLKIYKCSFNEVTAHYLNKFTDTLFEILLNTSKNYNRGLILEYRIVALKYLFKSRLNFLTQLFIYIDITGYVSSCFVKLYLLSKRIFSH